MSHTGQSLLLTSVTGYFEKRPELKKDLANIINGRSVISLRVIDWFVTHYTSSCNVIYWVDDARNRLVETFPASGGNSLRKVHLYLDYRAQLKSYTKLNFDPFRRHNRISFVIGTSPQTVLETTVGQLNFFRWCFQNHIIEYIYNHLTEIEASMARFFHERKTKTRCGSPAMQGDGAGAGAGVVTGTGTGVVAGKRTVNNGKDNQNLQKRGGREKRASTKTHTDIIAAPCCLHFS